MSARRTPRKGVLVLTKRSTLKAARHAVMALAGASFVLGSGAALAGDLENKLIGSVLGIIGATPPKDPIDYQARSPLVLPPSNELPPPNDGVAVGDAAAWPNDPDDAARQARAAQAKKGVYETSEISYKNERLSPEEMQAGRLAGAGLSGKPEDRASQIAHNERANAKLSPAEMRQQFIKLNPEPELGPDGMPTRRYLTEPPSEYRVPAATAAYDVEAAKEAAKEKRAAPVNDRNALR